VLKQTRKTVKQNRKTLKQPFLMGGSELFSGIFTGFDWFFLPAPAKFALFQGF
jgi:hypothetical protein